MDDAALIARVLSGDREGFTVLVERYHDGCRRFAAHMLGNLDDADDAVQETFLRAYRALGRYHERDLFRSWLYRILVNRCRTFARQRARRDVRFVNDVRAMNEAPSHDHAPSPWRGALATSLAELPTPQREALLLKHGEGLEYHEMAEITGVSVPALKMRVKRALDTLRPRLRAMSDA
jgi:RNA polymerase sigma-70 factor (ECF subfamily)